LFCLLIPGALKHKSPVVKDDGHPSAETPGNSKPTSVFASAKHVRLAH
jgi:hypothetical protein